MASTLLSSYHLVQCSLESITFGPLNVF